MAARAREEVGGQRGVGASRGAASGGGRGASVEYVGPEGRVRLRRGSRGGAPAPEGGQKGAAEGSGTFRQLSRLGGYYSA